METTYFVKSLAYLFHETFEGSPEGQGSAYLDRGIGVLATLDSLTAEQVSHDINGTSIAAQTEHAKFYLDRLCEFIHGRTEKVNWDDSWLIEDVSETEWTALREGVRKSYENVLRCFAETDEWSEDHVGMAMGMLAHTAYHFGAIRQLAKAV
ncbi:MAG: hypothetical protein JSS81_04300 [Acidobacteria bacterium]|nr:hypothetical protein [Acidobacteriota bacterium]